jgi:hypothetical protein
MKHQLYKHYGYWTIECPKHGTYYFGAHWKFDDTLRALLLHMKQCR